MSFRTHQPVAIIPVELLQDNRFNQSKSSNLAFKLICYLYYKSTNNLYREEVARDLGVSIPTLDRAIRSAKDLGWLSITFDKLRDDYGNVIGSIPVWNVHTPEEVAWNR